MGTNDILNMEADNDLNAKSVIDIAKECVPFGVKDVFVLSRTVNTRCNSAFISAVNKCLNIDVQCISFIFLITQT